MASSREEKTVLSFSLVKQSPAHCTRSYSKIQILTCLQKNNCLKKPLKTYAFGSTIFRNCLPQTLKTGMRIRFQASILKSNTSPHLTASQGNQVIDFYIEHRLQTQGIAPTPVCDDRTFQRRLYLDLVGHPPTLEESEAFLRSPSNIDKRSKEVERLLKTNAFATHFAELFDTMLMERRGKRWEDKRRKNGWHDYLETVFANNRPWDEVVRELIIARKETDDGSTCDLVPL
jgi:hypothetical protein